MPFNFEFPKEPKESVMEGRETEPRLRYIEHALEFLRPEADGSRWQELAGEIKPYENGVELSENIRDVVREYVGSKIPGLKERVQSIGDLSDTALLNAFTNSWFEEFESEEAGASVEGQRREVLLMTMAHVVRRIEQFAYKKHLTETSEENLQKLGLNLGLRDLLIEVMDASTKADPLFIRFVAFTQLAGKPGEHATPEGLTMPGAEAAMTIAALFPRETQFIARRFDAIAEGTHAWDNESGAATFKEYIKTLADYYREADPETARGFREKGSELYRLLIAEGFPILVTSGFEGYYKEPYIDPELKVSVATPDAVAEEQRFKTARDGVANHLGDIHAEQFSDDLRNRLIRSTNVFGAYGVNLSFNAVAQEEPAILLFLNEQIRAYDRDFHRYVEKIGGTDALLRPEHREALEHFSRMGTMLHEFSHSVYPDGSPEAERLGREPLTVIDEAKAETLYRSLVPSLIKDGVLEGTEEAWAQAMLASSFQVLEQQSKDDPYFYADAYLLNMLFAGGAIRREGERVVIHDYSAYWQAMRSATEGVLAVYRDTSMTERGASRWVKENCVPSKESGEVIAHLREGKKS